MFGDIMTAGMRDELQFCKNLNITVRKISEQEVEQKLGGAA
jgi:hypothetical protein